MAKMTRLTLIVTEEMANDIRSYLDKLLDLIEVDETHEWMKENEVFDNIHELYAKIDEVETVIMWADAGTTLTTDTRRQIFDLLTEYYERF